MLHILPVLVFPATELLLKADPVQNFDKGLETFINNLLHTMYNKNGVGLAAPQVGVSQRVFVIDTSAERNDPRIFVNPVLRSLSKDKSVKEEGCLSLPNTVCKVERAKSLVMTYQDVNGVERQLLCSDFLARVVQHEYDHLEGVLITHRSQ